MLVRFFFLLRSAGVPVSITELLTLLEALKQNLSDSSAERFYYLARTCLVKDERHYDRFDRAFAAHFKGAEDLFALLARELPADWLQKMAVRDFTDAEKAQIEALGGWDKLMETLKKRLEEQQGRHQGAANGSGRPALRRSALTATTPRACASDRTSPAIAVRSRCGTGANSRTSTIGWNSARAT